VGEALFSRGRFAARPALPGDAEAVAAGMRPADLAEVLAAGFADGRDAIDYSLARSPLVALAMAEEGRPIALCGVAQNTLLALTGQPWVLGTVNLDRPCAQRAFLYFSSRVAGLMRARYARLENWVDARYPAAVRWIEWMGFNLDPPAPYGVRGELFHRFWWERGA
jgi:hypothetical protein